MNSSTAVRKRSETRCKSSRAVTRELLQRYLDTLGTVAAISPLLGLLGTVIGMVKVFAAITTHGVGNPTVLAGGIAEALITTAAGLTVAIPAPSTGRCIFRFSSESDYMVEIVKSGGWLMVPIILCAIIAMGIMLERFWTLQQKRVIPEDLTSKVWGWVKKDQLDQGQIQTLHQGSALGQILAAGLINRDYERAVMKDSIEETGRHVVHELQRYLDTLGTVAAISPLLGLLGTVIGMVKVFAAITTHGVGNPTVLAGGIAEALITTAAGLTVAIPALIGYRFYSNRVDTLVVDMEKEAIKLVEALHRRQASSGKKK